MTYVLRPGTRVLYWDDDANGHAALCGPATVVRARGTGVLLEIEPGRQFRIARGCVGKIVMTCPVCAGRSGACIRCGGEGWVAEECRR